MNRGLQPGLRPEIPDAIERRIAARLDTLRAEVLATVRAEFGRRIILSAHSFVPVSSGGPLLFSRSGGSTPNELAAQGLSFSQTADEYADGRVAIMPPWFAASSGLKVRIPYACDATSGNVVLQAGFRRLDAAEDYTASHTYAFQSVTVAVPSTAMVFAVATITFGASQIDGILAGEPYVLRVGRNAANSADTVDAHRLLIVTDGIVIEEA